MIRSLFAAEAEREQQDSPAAHREDNMQDIENKVRSAFADKYGAPPPVVVRAPGRVNLIGEHTDYNDGFVMPMAINRETWIALRPREDKTVILRALDHGEAATFDVNELRRDQMTWREYPKGVTHVLKESGYPLRGWEGVTACDVPMGAGLSSSASYELAVARAFSAASGFSWDAARMAVLCQKAENEWVGVKCGIMDQMISAVGEKDKAVLIDCRDLSRRTAPLPPGTAVVIMDTMTRRGLVDSAYNERRRQCHEAAAHFGVKALRDVDSATFNRRASDLDPTVRRRARHVISENERTLAAVEAMCRGDAVALGKLMNASHDSLRDDFEVTNDALNRIVDLARREPGCFGARMTGAGFGGCAVALVRDTDAEAFTRNVSEGFRRAGGQAPSLYVTPAADGATVV
jgi:galactokinase